MACPVCDHTMKNLGVPGTRLFWCIRCGTLKEEIGEAGFVEMPLHMRHVLQVANLDPPRAGAVQSNAVEADFQVKQQDMEHPRIELAIYNHRGERVW